MSQMNYVKAKESIKIKQDFFSRFNCTSIAWLGGAGFIINSRGTIILIDPALMTLPGSENVSETGLKLYSPYPINAGEIPRADIVLYTHTDSDHLGRATAKVLAGLEPRFIGPHTVFRELVMMGVNPQNIETCRTGDNIQINNLTIEATPADHPWQLLDIRKYGKPFRKGDCCGFIITTPDGRCFFPGDTRLMEEHLAISDIDLLALDVSIDIYHLGTSGARALANSMAEALLVPIHYGTYDAPGESAHCGNPMDVLDKVENGSGRARILAPGEILILNNTHTLLQH